MKPWRMPEKCADCPFANVGPGKRLRKTLRPGRWREILKGLRNGFYFPCHKTTDETGNANPLVCAGSIEWQEHNHYSSAYVRICQYIEQEEKKEEATADTRPQPPPRAL